MKSKLKIVKIGGNIINNEERLISLLKDFSQISGPKILVHGGGKKATKMAASLGLESKMIDGRRVTDAANLEIVTMVYAGLLNKKISMVGFEGVPTNTEFINRDRFDSYSLILKIHAKKDFDELQWQIHC